MSTETGTNDFNYTISSFIVLYETSITFQLMSTLPGITLGAGVGLTLVCRGLNIFSNELYINNCMDVTVKYYYNQGNNINNINNN